MPATDAAFSNMYNTLTTSIAQTHTSVVAIVYTFTSPPGLPLSGGGIFAAQISGDGTQHVVTTDSGSLNSTAGATTFSQSGTF